MKHLLLSLVLIISVNAWADICNIQDHKNPNSYKDIFLSIQKLGCKKGDILNVTEGRNFVQIDSQLAVANFCNLDKEIFKTNMGFVCELEEPLGRYDREPNPLG